MKVERIIGWLTGSAGTGNVFEISHEGGYLLAMIWQDGKFHQLSFDDLNKQLTEGTAAVAQSAIRDRYLSNVPTDTNGSLNVENPNGWQRLFESKHQEQGGDEMATETKQVIELPFKFEGKLTIDLSKLGEIIKLIE